MSKRRIVSLAMLGASLLLGAAVPAGASDPGTMAHCIVQTTGDWAGELVNADSNDARVHLLGTGGSRIVACTDA